MIIKVNLKGGFKTVQEGERILEITEAKVTPSGAPDKLVLTMKDIEDGATLQNTFNFKNENSLRAMCILLNVALGLNDGDDFDPKKDADELLNVKLLCEVIHREYNEKNYANVKKVIKRIDTEPVLTSEEPVDFRASEEPVDFRAIDETLYGRSILTDNDDLD